MAALTIVRAGMLTTLQDLGRWGHQGSGVPVAGPMDEYAHRLANGLVGNPDSAAALEITLLGPELQCDAETLCAVTGATFELTVDGEAAPLNAPFRVGAGSRLRFGNRLAGSRATLAVRGGIDLPPAFGSRATSLVSRLGPFGGRALRAGDVLPIGSDPGGAPGRAGQPMRLPAGGARVRVMMGPHDGMFTATAIEALLTAPFVITTQSNRMGYRLQGPALAHVESADILSDATPMGSVQVPGSGQPILLMADRQTTGGYPKIATVITADLPVVGQLAPGDWIRFTAVTRAGALEALQEREAGLSGAGR